MCYSMYLFHYQVIAGAFAVTRDWAAATSPVVYFALQASLGAAAVLLFTCLWFVLIERPCMVRDWPQRLWARLSSSSSSRAEAAAGGR